MLWRMVHSLISVPMRIASSACGMASAGHPAAERSPARSASALRRGGNRPLRNCPNAVLLSSLDDIGDRTDRLSLTWLTGLSPSGSQSHSSWAEASAGLRDPAASLGMRGSSGQSRRIYQTAGHKARRGLYPADAAAVNLGR